ncbi:MAG: DUF6134 family protein [Pseudomonadota bacterium]
MPALQNEGADQKQLHYRIYRKGKNIGNHYISFKREDDQASVDINFSIRVKFLGITAFKMDHEATETWSYGPLELESLSAVTDRSSGVFRVNVDHENNGYMIDVNGEQLPAPQNFVPTSFTTARHLFGEARTEVILLDTLSGILRPSQIEFRDVVDAKDFPSAVGEVRYYEITRSDTGDVTHRIWYDETDAFVRVGLKTKDGHYVEYRRQA